MSHRPNTGGLRRASRILAALTPLAAQGAAAQEAILLDPIYVSGAKRPQEAFSYPGAVEQVWAGEIEESGAASVAEVEKLFPGFAADARSSRVYTNFTLRGQSSLDYYNPSVQVYVDGLPQDPALLGQLFPSSLESVEVLYGPQGSLYGRGAVGGVINVTTLKPGEGERLSFGGSLSDGGHRARLRGELQLADGLWADLGLGRNHQNDDLRAFGTGEELGGTTENQGQIRLRYAPEGGPLDVMLSAARNELSSTEEQFVLGPDLKARRTAPFPSHYEHDSTSLGLTASYDLGGAELSSLTGYQKRFLDRTIFGSYTPERQETLTQEVRLSSQPDGGALDYVVGVYGAQSAFQREAYGSATEQDTTSAAVFADLTWRPTERLSISPGLRFDYEKTKASASGAMTLSDSDNWSALTPKLGASYELSPEWSAYGLVGGGFKAGGFTRTLTPANIAFTYDPSKTWSGEIGLKHRSADGPLEASVSAFYSVTDDYQMFVGAAPAQYLQNVGEVVAKGVEGRLRYAKDGWTVTGGASFGDSTFSDHRDPTNPALSYKGNRTPYTPQVTARLGVEREFALGGGWGALAPRVAVSHQGKIWFDEANAMGQGAYTLLDAGLAWRLEDGTTLDLYATNLTDEVYASYGFDATAYGMGEVYQLGRGREIGLRLSRSF